MIRAILMAVGLVTGSLHVEVELESPTRSIEIRLDGRAVAEISQPPFETWVDLGDELRPRRLTVISRDGGGQELDRRIRWLNLRLPVGDPERPRTPIAIVLDDGRQPDGLTSWFEVGGRPAEVLDVETPDAELWIVRDPGAQPEIERTASVALGGELDWGESVDGAVLRAGPEATLAELSSDPQFSAEARYRFSRAWDRWLGLFGFEDTTLRFVSPWGAPVSQVEQARLIFSSTPPVDVHAQGLLYQLYATRPLSTWYRLADAVGIAGMEAHAGARRRAVLVLTADPDDSDQSLHAPGDVRRYLAELGVPLFVWCVDPHFDPDDGATPWGEVRAVAMSRRPGSQMRGDPGFGFLRNFEAAYEDLARTLRRQRIVWLAGHHLPADVTLSPRAHGVRLAGAGPVGEKAR